MKMKITSESKSKIQKDDSSLDQNVIVMTTSTNIHWLRTKCIYWHLDKLQQHEGKVTSVLPFKTYVNLTITSACGLVENSHFYFVEEKATTDFLEDSSSYYLTRIVLSSALR